MTQTRLETIMAALACLLFVLFVISATGGLQ